MLFRQLQLRIPTTRRHFAETSPMQFLLTELRSEGKVCHAFRSSLNLI